MEEQREVAKELISYFKEQSLRQSVRSESLLGWTRANEISNGRWVMFGILVGLLTEYATYVAAAARGRDAVPRGWLRRRLSPHRSSPAGAASDASSANRVRSRSDALPYAPSRPRRKRSGVNFVDQIRITISNLGIADVYE